MPDISEVLQRLEKVDQIVTSLFTQNIIVILIDLDARSFLYEEEAKRIINTITWNSC